MGGGEVYKKAEDVDLAIYLFIINKRRRNLRRIGFSQRRKILGYSENETASIKDPKVGGMKTNLESL